MISLQSYQRSHIYAHVCYNAKSLTQTARTIIVWLEPMDRRQVTITHLPFALSVADFAPLLGEDKYVVVGPATRACG